MFTLHCQLAIKGNPSCTLLEVERALSDDSTPAPDHYPAQSASFALAASLAIVRLRGTAPGRDPPIPPLLAFAGRGSHDGLVSFNPRGQPLDDVFTT